VALGDSTMLLSLPGLAADGFEANAHGCRELYQAVDMLGRLKAQGALPHMVVIALGSNGTVSQANLDDALRVMGRTRLLVLMTPRELGGGSGSDTANERIEAARHPGQILLLDWVRESAGHSNWFQPDGLHLTYPGVSAFTALIDQAFPYAYVPCPQPSARHPARRPQTQRSALPADAAGAAKRLAVTIKPGAAVGGSLTIDLRDRTRRGGLPLTICLTPPGARPTCKPWHLRDGHPQREIQLATPRPGGWRVTVKTPGQQSSTRVVWASHPGGRIRLYAAGDSEMQILDSLIGQDLASHGVDVTSDARISTGLTNSAFFDWQGEARRKAAGLQPDVSVVFLGANDGYAVPAAGGGQAGCCGSDWSAGYANLAAQMMSTLLRGQAGQVYWFLLPTPRPANFKTLFDAVNAGLRTAAGRFPGRVHLIDANAFFTPHDQYRDFMVYHGHGFVIHESDGIHLSTASDQVAAGLLLQQLISDRVIR
jgi:lysophospholipase L1-like esterase